jgi:hypothetical protein
MFVEATLIITSTHRYLKLIIFSMIDFEFEEEGKEKISHRTAAETFVSDRPRITIT